MTAQRTTTSPIAQRVYQIVSSIPVGKVLTYGDIAYLAGLNTPRVVGHYLHNNPDPSTIPCHRVVNAAGRCAPNFAFGLATAQEQLLKGEGVPFKGSHVDLSTARWNDAETVLHSIEI